MSDEAAKKNSMPTVLIGTSIILWILAVFLIMRINKVNDTLTELLETQRQNFGIMSSQSPANYEIRDSEGNLVYTIEMKEQDDMMMDDGMYPGMDGDVPGGEGAAPEPTPKDGAE